MAKSLAACTGVLDEPHEPYWGPNPDRAQTLRRKWLAQGIPQTIGFEGTREEPDWPQPIRELGIWSAHPECRHCRHGEPEPEFATFDPADSREAARLR